MNIFNLHLLFHPLSQTEPPLYRLECLGSVESSCPPITVGLSPRLIQAVHNYQACFDPAKWQERHIEMMVTTNLLTAWIGRLMWDNLFAETDGMPNAVGKAILSGLEEAKRASGPFRIFLHLGNVSSQSILARLPWASLLFRWPGEDQAYHSLARQPGVNLLCHWTVVHPAPPVLAQKSHLRLLLTFGGDPMGSNDAARKVYELVREVVRRFPTELQLVTCTTKTLELTSFVTQWRGEVDIWIHAGHGLLGASSEARLALYTQQDDAFAPLFAGAEAPKTSARGDLTGVLDDVRLLGSYGTVEKLQRELIDQKEESKIKSDKIKLLEAQVMSMQKNMAEINQVLALKPTIQEVAGELRKRL